MGSGTFRRRGMKQVSGHDAATVRVEPTGEVRGFVSAASQGRDTPRRWRGARRRARRLADAVSIVEGDTERCPHGSGSFASRSMVVSGGALVLAARRVREKIRRSRRTCSRPRAKTSRWGRDDRGARRARPHAHRHPGRRPRLSACRRHTAARCRPRARGDAVYDPPPATFPTAPTSRWSRSTRTRARCTRSTMSWWRIAADREPHDRRWPDERSRGAGDRQRAYEDSCTTPAGSR